MPDQAGRQTTTSTGGDMSGSRQLLRCRMLGHRWEWSPCPPHLIGWFYRCRRCPAERVL